MALQCKYILYYQSALFVDEEVVLLYNYYLSLNDDFDHSDWIFDYFVVHIVVATIYRFDFR